MLTIFQQDFEIKMSNLEKQLREKDEIISCQVNTIQDLQDKIKQFENPDSEEESDPN